MFPITKVNHFCVMFSVIFQQLVTYAKTIKLYLFTAGKKNVLGQPFPKYKMNKCVTFLLSMPGPYTSIYYWPSGLRRCLSSAFLLKCTLCNPDVLLLILLHKTIAKIIFIILHIYTYLKSAFFTSSSIMLIVVKTHQGTFNRSRPLWAITNGFKMQGGVSFQFIHFGKLLVQQNIRERYQLVAQASL